MSNVVPLSPALRRAAKTEAMRQVFASAGFCRRDNGGGLEIFCAILSGGEFRAPGPDCNRWSEKGVFVVASDEADLPVWGNEILVGVYESQAAWLNGYQPEKMVRLDFDPSGVYVYRYFNDDGVATVAVHQCEMGDPTAFGMPAAVADLWEKINLVAID